MSSKKANIIRTLPADECTFDPFEELKAMRSSGMISKARCQRALRFCFQNMDLSVLIVKDLLEELQE